MPAGLIMRREMPLCAETDPAQLVDSFFTPTDAFFVRNHGPIPVLAADHPVAITGLVANPTHYSADQLKAAFAPRTVAATVQCAGNRRAHLQDVAPTKGDLWDVGAIGTAEWTGVMLDDVLAAAGVGEGAAHVAFTAADLAEGGGATAPYQVSVPLALARERGAMIAWAMNGAPLSPEHGFPLRIILPGAAGVRSVKWLTGIEVRSTESPAPMHARDYKLFPPEVTAEAADWSTGTPIYDLPVNAAICVPSDGDAVLAGSVELRGWAMAAEGISRVELSSDGGASWESVVLERGPDPGSWVLWRARPTLAEGQHDLIVRAFDRQGRGQPADPAAIWNFKGYVANAWHRVTVTAV